MIETKDFLAYARKRYGLPPRSIIINTVDRLFNDHDILTASDKFKVVEYGFSHGNDARLLIDTMIAEIGLSGWEYWGFDHKDYFFTEGILNHYDRKIQRNIHLVPCLFEEIAYGSQSIPQKVSAIYSSKSLSLCDREAFPSLMRTILDSVAVGGAFIGTLHLNSQEQTHFKNVDEYMEMFFEPASGEAPLFCGFDTQFSIDTARQTFAVYAKKTGQTKVVASDMLLVERNGSKYIEVSYEK